MQLEVSEGPPQGSQDPPLQQTSRTAEVVAEVDPEPENNLSDGSGDGYETGSMSGYSASISSSILHHMFENNRRYHKYKEGRYLIPNDDLEQEREDMMHSMILHVCGGKLHLAPLSNPQEILDIGTGTGIWALDSKPDRKCTAL